MPNVTVRIMKNGKISVETHGMHGKECVPYVEKICEALEAVPLDLPDSPQPVFDFSGAAQYHEDYSAYEEEKKKNYLFS